MWLFFEGFFVWSGFCFVLFWGGVFVLTEKHILDFNIHISCMSSISQTVTINTYKSLSYENDTSEHLIEQNKITSSVGSTRKHLVKTTHMAEVCKHSQPGEVGHQMRSVWKLFCLLITECLQDKQYNYQPEIHLLLIRESQKTFCQCYRE